MVNCIKCGLEFEPKSKTQIKTNTCRRKCDGIQRDWGGWPLDPELRKKALLENKLRRKEKNLIKSKEKWENTPITNGIMDKKVVPKLNEIFKKYDEKINYLSQKVREIEEWKKSIPFWESKEWRSIRYEAFRRFGRKCALCNDTEKVLHVDHIKPRSKYPELELEITNLQVLCIDCNLGKSNKPDWRP